MKPVFKKKEIVIEKQDVGVLLGGGNTVESVGIIKYVGAKVENYKVGDKILYDKAVARLEIKYFGKPLLRIENEDYVICQIKEDDE